MEKGQLSHDVKKHQLLPRVRGMEKRQFLPYA
jgi:hypothetical protein